MKKERLKEINEIMSKVYYPTRYLWCEASVCGCMGCINRSEGLPKKCGLTKNEWEEWVRLNPRNKRLCGSCYVVEINRIPEKDKNNGKDKFYQCPECGYGYWAIT